MQQPKFENDAVRTITEQAIQECLKNQVYDHSAVNKWSSDILENTLRALCERFQSYKFVSQCLILQKAGGGLHVSSSCYWDSNSDGMVTVRWENESMHCIVSIYGLAVQ
ncbi:Dynein light chain Tctex-type 1 [Histomonas meleagridis]|uniref:Dynein light chain Tctex-type 1 n=1 Tax=Histomonas meleagridis TaxID=135588 RepID=UPI00355AB88C|nr:Dynein light chain Tctex-type 1 [Histomonas meleagridis]KAH0798407.1 Dynein light chain Tctex-type 1 [Histomonas meleagridis]